MEKRVERRRSRGNDPARGVALLLGYEALSGSPDAAGRCLAFEVDESVHWPRDGRPRFSISEGRSSRVAEWMRDAPADRREPARLEEGSATTSLPKPAYLGAVEGAREAIAAGDVYQANVCQRIEGLFRGDPWELFRRLDPLLLPPRAAYLESPELTLLSCSPEAFLRQPDATRVETWPIKGTRARESDPVRDRRVGEELLRSTKDRAELLMIVDLERNDLSRVCQPGTVRTGSFPELQSFPNVHHLVTRVHGSLLPGVGVERLVRATFPGGSITGAPKLAAIELLRRLEPAERGFFTGSLFWFGDDGRTDSSILIRTIVFEGDRFYIGAGGGIVDDSVPEDEWLESNHKVRGLCRAMGFDPEQVGR